MPFAQIGIHPWGTLMYHLQQLNRVTDGRDTSFPHDPGTQGWVEQRKGVRQLWCSSYSLNVYFPAPSSHLHVFSESAEPMTLQ